MGTSLQGCWREEDKEGFPEEVTADPRLEERARV